MGRLSNPSDHLNGLVTRGARGAGLCAKHRSQGVGTATANPDRTAPRTRGRLSNPASRRVQRRIRPPEVDRLAAEYRAGRSLREVADILGVHHDTIAAHLEALGIARRPAARKLTPDDVLGAIAKYASGDSLATIARALDVDATTVRRELRRAGVSTRPRPGWPA